MSELEYKLYGFASGGGVAPQFLEPVFVNRHTLFVQSCNKKTSPDTVTSFVKFTDKVEVTENRSEELSQLGEKRIFAIRDIGDRIICGDRDYVSKYLILNLNSYIDQPYFFKNVCDFSGVNRPDLVLFSTHGDLQEMAALSHSVKRFCDIEYSRPSSSFPISKMVPKELRYYHLSFDIFQSRKDRDIFSRWLEFAKSDSPRLAHHSKWKNISRKYISIFDNDEKTAKESVFSFYITARNIVNDKDFNSKLSNINSKSMNEKQFNISIEGLTERATIMIFESRNHKLDKSVVRKYISSKAEGGLKEASRSISRKIYKNILLNLITKTELSMMVYLLTIVSKRAVEILSDKEDV